MKESEKTEFVTRAALARQLGQSVDTIERRGKRYAFFRRCPGGYHREQVQVIIAFLAGALDAADAERLWAAKRRLLIGI